jgi:hypothetical protein
MESRGSRKYSAPYKKTNLVKFLIFIHAIFFITWAGLFFIPSSVWPDRIFYHFWYVISVLVFNFSWGNLLRIKNNRKNGLFVCMLTTITQYARGHNLNDQNNYSHSFFKEMLSKFNRYNLENHSEKIISVLAFLSLFIISYQYFFLY